MKSGAFQNNHLRLTLNCYFLVQLSRLGGLLRLEIFIGTKAEILAQKSLPFYRKN